MMREIELKIYGTARVKRGEKRIRRRGKYYAVTRDKKGRFTSIRNWSPKKTNIRETRRYVEEFKTVSTGKEAKLEVLQEYHKYPEWIDFGVET